MTSLPGMHHCRDPSCRVDALCTALGNAFLLCRETEFFALTNAASWLQPYGKFFMVSPMIWLRLSALATGLAKGLKGVF